LSPDGTTGSYLLRIWETAGRNTETEITLPENSGIKSARLMDLRGRPTGSSLTVSGNRIKVEVPANQPISIQLSKE
jgi:hypothetical protein